MPWYFASSSGVSGRRNARRPNGPHEPCRVGARVEPRQRVGGARRERGGRLGAGLEVELRPAGRRTAAFRCWRNPSRPRERGSRSPAKGLRAKRSARRPSRRVPTAVREPLHPRVDGRAVEVDRARPPGGWPPLPGLPRTLPVRRHRRRRCRPWRLPRLRPRCRELPPDRLGGDPLGQGTPAGKEERQERRPEAEHARDTGHDTWLSPRGGGGITRSQCESNHDAPRFAQERSQNLTSSDS